MMNFKIGKIQQLITIFIWLLILFIPLMFGEYRDEVKWDHVFRIWIEYGYVFIIFLINRLVLVPRLFFKGKRGLYFISLMGMILVFISSMYLRERPGQGMQAPEAGHRMPENHRLQEHPPRAMDDYEYHNRPSDDEAIADRPRPEMREQGSPNHPPRGRRNSLQALPPVQFIPPYANLLVLTILLLGFDTGLFISIKWLESEQTQIKLEKENVENKMAFLQNQISPHFFMNTLNNIHALVDISTEEAKEAIIRLSRMMGYMLYESKTDTVPLHKEMEFIQSYIDLMRIRFADSVEVELDIPAELPNVNIPPLLTISFIENAFKHGISYTEPCFVRISFSFDADRMTFDVINKVFERKAKDGNSGVGLENAKKRLDLIYGKTYNLEIGKLPQNLFAVNLNVPL